MGVSWIQDWGGSGLWGDESAECCEVLHLCGCGLCLCGELSALTLHLSAGMIFNEADQEVRDTGYHRHAFNILISNRLGYHRELPDTRDSQ